MAQKNEVQPLSKQARTDFAASTNAYVPVRGQVLSRVEPTNGQEVIARLGLLLILLAIAGGAMHQWERGKTSS